MNSATFASLLSAVALLAPASATPQERPQIKVQSPGASEVLVHLDAARGYSTLTVDDVRRVGWTAESVASGVMLTGPGGARVRVQAGTPYFTWGDDVLQLADPPYAEGGALRIPAQLVMDFFPSRLPKVYAWDGATGTLRVAPGGSSAGAGAAPAASAGTRGAAAGTRVVIIDAGHGGSDPGAIGPGNVREKNVALGIARALAEELHDTPGFEVHLLRDDDTFIPLWDRGPKATDLRRERPGVFISIHANSMPTRRSARGFETYFLSDARTDDERRVAAIENAPLRVEASGPDGGDGLDFILRELTNLDHTHWSSLLAELVQAELAHFHPGPNRGVKQGPLAVLTNALMPSVLVEIGFVSNAEEAPLLGRAEFQKNAAAAIAVAVHRFFERYPPGNGGGGGGGP
ncbi:MAG TPA: N-acetylmuramoyl-L-alanine amidase [Longimicrobiales bacterium]|nr:N-acetylmuramoyl-L-alanine amidase [Longimicrobiales bacterium]